MELHRTDEGFALYKEKTQIGFCALTPAPKVPPDDTLSRRLFAALYV